MERFVHRPDNEAIGKDDTRGFGATYRCSKQEQQAGNNPAPRHVSVVTRARSLLRNT